MGEGFIGASIFLGVLALVVSRVRRGVAHLDDIEDMRSVPVVRLGDVVEDDVVRVVGKVVAAGSLLVSPSGRPCVFYDFELRLRLERSPIVARREICAFHLEDGGTRALVLPPCPIVVVAVRVHESGSSEDLPPALQAWLEENHASDEWKGRERLSWRECLIEPGDPLAVVGFARRELADVGTSNYREAPSLVVFENHERAPLSLSDDRTLL